MYEGKKERDRDRERKEQKKTNVHQLTYYYSSPAQQASDLDKFQVNLNNTTGHLIIKQETYSRAILPPIFLV